MSAKMFEKTRFVKETVCEHADWSYEEQRYGISRKGKPK